MRHAAAAPYSPGKSLKWACLFVGFLWLIKAWEGIWGVDLHTLGVLPRDPGGLVGILTGPLIHGSLEHLAANSLGVLVLGAALLYGYPVTRWRVLVSIWLLSGFGVWLFARASYHFGASGITHGVFFYLLVSSLLRRDKRSIALMMIAFFFFGGMLLTIFPRDPGISFESHFAGAVAGLLCALLWWRLDPRPAEKRYDWEGQDDEGEDAVIGDFWQASPGDGDTDEQGSTKLGAVNPTGSAPRSTPPPRPPKAQ